MTAMPWAGVKHSSLSLSLSQLTKSVVPEDSFIFSFAGGRHVSVFNRML